MRSQSEMDVLEVKRQLLEGLEDMGFPKARAARALYNSGNSSLEAAIEWIVDHENDPDIDRMPPIAVDIDIESPPQPSQTAEEIQEKLQELRDRARKMEEEEEQKLEREREKERIRAGKEILEAQRIAENSKRLRNLALRKAEKEEEKRAREQIRQKLEADKAERRRMHGFASGSSTVVNRSKPIMPEEKNSFLAVSVAKAIELRECLRSIKRNYKDDNDRVNRAFQTLLVIVGNVVKNPDEEKYRKIRIGNPMFLHRVGRLGGNEFLELCGFERIEGGEFLFLPRKKLDMAILNTAGFVLKSAISNPFFGLLSIG